MKSEYTKPMLAIELFSVTQAGAKDCADTTIPGTSLTLADPGACGMMLPNGDILYVVGPHCNRDGESSGIVCYNNPNEGSYIFRS